MATFNNATGTTGDIYTATSTTVVIGILVGNTHTTDTAVCDVSIAGQQILNDLNIPIGGCVELIQGKVVLANLDKVNVTSSAGSVGVVVSVLEGV